MYLVLIVMCTTLEIYISSDWFTELGYNFFDYHYTAELIKSTNEVKYLMAELALNFLDDNTDKEHELINKIVETLAKEASIDKNSRRSIHICILWRLKRRIRLYI